MSSLIPTEFFDEIRSRLNVSDVVGRFVKLRKVGNEYEGLCPFHNEKTPSFTVNDRKGFYHCFGCGAHGDIIKFLMEHKGYKFMEAVESLAQDAGLSMPIRDNSHKSLEEVSDVKQIYEVLKIACDYYHKKLFCDDDPESSKALEYIKNRGITISDIKKFGLGLAPSRGDEQYDYFRKKGFSDRILVKAGLLSRRGDGGDVYAKFRNRLMFPIFDMKGRVIAFGGRVLGGEAKPKYLNSPETEVFHKGWNLYAQHIARENLRHSKDKKNSSNHQSVDEKCLKLIICEGYTDVIALHRYGFGGAVAPLGTAITEEQIKLLWKISTEPVFCFDGDNAGYRAAIRACEKSISVVRAGYGMRFVFLPSGEDPDSFLGKYGVDKFSSLVNDNAMDMYEFYWKYLYYEHNMAESVSDDSALRKSIDDIISQVEDKNVQVSLRQFFKQKIFEANGEKFRKKLMLSNKRKGRYSNSVDGCLNLPDDAGENSLFPDKLLLAAVVNNPEIIKEYYSEFFSIGANLNDERLKYIYNLICEAYDDGEENIKEFLTCNGVNVDDELFSLDVRAIGWSKKAKESSDLSRVFLGWKAHYDKYIYMANLVRELNEAKQIYLENDTEDNLRRLNQLQNLVNEFRKKEEELLLCSAV